MIVIPSLLFDHCCHANQHHKIMSVAVAIIYLVSPPQRVVQVYVEVEAVLAKLQKEVDKYQVGHSTRTSLDSFCAGCLLPVACYV